MASYKELSVYRKSYELVKEIYRQTENLPAREQYGMQGQIRRAAVSVPLNIAEGYGKQSGAKETARFLSMARGSCCEVDVLLNLLQDLGYMQEGVSRELAYCYEEVGKMLTGLIQSLTDN